MTSPLMVTQSKFGLILVVVLGTFLAGCSSAPSPVWSLAPDVVLPSSCGPLSETVCNQALPVAWTAAQDECRRLGPAKCGDPRSISFSAPSAVVRCELSGDQAATPQSCNVVFTVSTTAGPVSVGLIRQDDGSWDSAVLLPSPSAGT